MMKRLPCLVVLGIGGLLWSSCAPFPVPGDWPVAVEPDRSAERELGEVLISRKSATSLTRQERSLLSFLNDNERINEAIGKKDRYGTRTWKIAEIFLVEPGAKVSVLCEEGHTQEAIYFRYNPDNKVWYRVTDFEDPEAHSVPAVIVEEAS